MDEEKAIGLPFGVCGLLLTAVEEEPIFICGGMIFNMTVRNFVSVVVNHPKL